MAPLIQIRNHFRKVIECLCEEQVAAEKQLSTAPHSSAIWLPCSPPPFCRSPGGAPARGRQGAALQIQGQAAQLQQAQQSSHETRESINWLILLIMFGHCLAGPTVSRVVWGSFGKNSLAWNCFFEWLVASSNGAFAPLPSLDQVFWS